MHAHVFNVAGIRIMQSSYRMAIYNYNASLSYNTDMHFDALVMSITMTRRTMSASQPDKNLADRETTWIKTLPMVHITANWVK